MSSAYSRERSKYRQPRTSEPCSFCGATPAENCHIIDYLELRKRGVPPEICNEFWNLMPLCRPCHWIFDNRCDIWVKHRISVNNPINPRRAFGMYTGEFKDQHRTMMDRFQDQKNEAEAIISTMINRHLITLDIGMLTEVDALVFRDVNGLKISQIDLSELVNRGKITLLLWDYNAGGKTICI